MAREKILVVEDDDNIAELIRHHLEREQYSLARSTDGADAVERAGKFKPDLVLLDLMLPVMDGLDVCRRIKGAPSTAGIPVVIVSAKGEESDVVAGLELGADDYIAKPFRPKELVARVRTVLRRRRLQAAAGRDETIEICGMKIHPGRRELQVHGKPIELTFTEFEVLCLLARRPGWVFTRYQIVDGVRGSDYPVTDRSVDVQIVGLRKKIGKAADCIETVRGIGYRLKDCRQ